MSLIECYEKLQNARPTTFTVSELLREKQLGGGESKIRVKSKHKSAFLLRKNLYH